jgi:hypothetical protein
MFNEKDILARLRNGEDASAIADEMVNALNAANSTYVAEVEAAKKAAEEAAKKAALAEEKDQEKDDLADEIAETIMDYIKLCAPTLVEDIEEELSGAEVRKLLDSFIPMMVSLKGLAGIFTDAVPVPVEEPKSKLTIKVSPKTVIDDDDKIIRDFLKEILG